MITQLIPWPKWDYTDYFLAAICGGLADLVYFLFLDLGGFVNFMPATLMTFISSAAIILSFVAFSRNRKAGV
ncbi:MAG: hypothetical protein RIC95_05865 [Vicingaceae bacterium]